MSRKLKDSGIEWIGEIPEDWEIVKVKNIFNNHKNIVCEKENEYERLALTLNGVIKRSKEDSKGLQSESFSTYQIIYENDLVFKLIDLENVNTSRVGKSPYTGIVSPVYIILSNERESAFGYYYFLSLWHREIFNKLGGNGVRSALNLNDLNNLPYPQFDTRMKKYVAEYLDFHCTLIDQTIEKQKQVIEKLKEYKQSVILETITKGLNPNVPMKDSGIEWIGEIPEYWSIKKIKYLTSISRGLFTHRPRNDARLYDGDYPFIQTGDVARAGKYITEYTQTLNELGIVASKEFPKGTLTMTIAANVGDVAILDFNAYFPDSVIGFIPKYGYMCNYLYYLFISMRKEFINNSIVSTQLNLNVERVKDIKAPIIDSIEIQKEISEYLDKKCGIIDSAIANKENGIAKLVEYKKSLIYECVTGKREVK